MYNELYHSILRRILNTMLNRTDVSYFKMFFWHHNAGLLYKQSYPVLIHTEILYMLSVAKFKKTFRSCLKKASVCS